MDVIKSIDAFLLKVGKQDRLVTLFFIMMITIATFLRFYGIGDASLWLDEVLTITLSDLPFSTLWISNYDPTPPLYYSLMKLTLIFGDSHLLLRAPSAIFGILTVVAVYFMMRDIFNKKAAFASALLLSFSIAQIEYSQEARAYAMLTFFCCGIVWSTLGILIKDNDQNVTTKKYFILYFISASMSLYTHNVAVFFVFAANLSMLFYFFLSRKINIMTWWVTVNIILLLVWLPWLENVISGVSGGNNFNWLKHVSLTDFLITTFDLHRYYLITKFQPFLDYAFMGVLFYGLLKLRKDPKIFICIISFLLCSTFLLWLVGYIKPIFMNRTIVPSGIIVAIIFGFAIRSINHLSYVFILLLIIIFGSKSWINYHEQNIAENENWASAIKKINDLNTPLNLIVCREYVLAPVSYYLKTEVSSNISIFSSDIKNTGFFIHKEITRLKEYDWTKKVRIKEEFIDKYFSNKKTIMIDNRCSTENRSFIIESMYSLGLSEFSVQKYEDVKLLIFNH